MERKGISQEQLKLIACITMLLDHIGLVFFPGSFLRIIGRLSFPIYCYLLSEGVCHTRNRCRYGCRLLICTVLAEIPFDLVCYGAWNWGKQSVMVTLFLGYLFCVGANQIPDFSGRVLLLMPFIWLGELLRGDYGGWGIMIIGMFFLTRNLPQSRLLQMVCLGAVSLVMSKSKVSVGDFVIPLQVFAVAAMVPICLHDGRKRVSTKWIQWGFYLFYPVHLLALYFIGRL